MMSNAHADRVLRAASALGAAAQVAPEVDVSWRRCPFDLSRLKDRQAEHEDLVHIARAGISRNTLYRKIKRHGIVIARVVQAGGPSERRRGSPAEFEAVAQRDLDL